MLLMSAVNFFLNSFRNIISVSKGLNPDQKQHPIVCLSTLFAYIANNMDPDQTAPLDQSDQGS